MIDNDYVSFYIGQVTAYNDTYKTSKSFSINVQTKVNNVVTEITNIIPANSNIKQIPILGENVLIYQAYNNKSSYLNREQQWYYLMPLNIQSNTNNNILPTITANFEPDSEFNDTAVSALQPFTGDILFEGRWGNTIRLGSTTTNSNKYSKNSTWNGDVKTDPIITISTRKPNSTTNEYVVENLQTDASSLYLTSTQKLSTLKLNNIIRTSTNESSFVGSQFIGTADRIILKSKSDIILLDSNSAVEINTPLISIGQKSNSSKEYGLHSEQVKDLFDTIIDVLNFGLVAGNIPVTINPALKSLFDSQIRNAKNKIDNKLIKQDKS